MGVWPHRTAFPEAADKGQVNTRTYEENEARSFTGALQGGEGTFRCTGSTCTVTADDEGALTFEGAWTFAFDEEAMVDEADEDYLHFGYWLKTTKEEDGDTYLFQTFWGGEEPFLETGARISGLEGAAIYAGPAAGVYVRKTLKADGRINHGHLRSFHREYRTDGDVWPNRRRVNCTR